MAPSRVNDPKLTWPHGHGYNMSMKTIPAGKFKDQCLKIMDRIVQTRAPVIVTKRGNPIVRVVPYSRDRTASSSLAASILKEEGDVFRTGEKWNADLP